MELRHKITDLIVERMEQANGQKQFEKAIDEVVASLSSVLCGFSVYHLTKIGRAQLLANLIKQLEFGEAYIQKMEAGNEQYN